MDIMEILWVENNSKFVHYSLEKFLSAHIVMVFPSLVAAKLTLMSNRFDAVLLDYDLDDGKGTELFPLIDALAVRPVIIAASSHADGNAKLMQAGADAICGKMDFAQISAVLLAEVGQKAISKDCVISKASQLSINH